MLAQIMGSKVYLDQVAGFFDNHQGRRISDREYSAVGFNGLLTDVLPEPLRHLLRNEDGFSLTAAFQVFKNQLLAI